MSRTQATAQPEARRARRDRILDWVEAGLWVGLVVFGTLVGLEVLRGERGAARSAAQRGLVAPSGVIEAESLEVLGTSRDFTFWLQPTSDFPDGRWSKDGHMFAYGTQAGDWIDLKLPDREPGSYGLEVFCTRSLDYGIVAFSVNGTRVNGEVDLWTELGVLPTGAVDLGKVQLRGSGDVLRVAVVGRNPEAAPPYFQFGIDGIRLKKQ